jgi:acyl carrier protein
MSREEFLQQIDELLDKAPGTLKGPEDLASEGWDSLSVISFIALVDQSFGTAVETKALARSKTVDDLLALVAPQLEGAKG